MMAAQSLISVDQRGAIRMLFLARADKRNAMTPEMLSALIEHIERFTQDQGLVQGSALVIGGEGRMFCSGFDLALCAAVPGACAELLTLLSRGIVALRRCPAPTAIAATNAAIAGAAALCGGADVAVGNTGGTYGYPVLRLGLSPAVSVPFMAARMEQGAVRTRALDVGLLDGLSARDVGLLTHVGQWPEDVFPKALAQVTALANKPRAAFAATKQWLAELDGANDAARVAAGLSASIGTASNAEMAERLAIALAPKAASSHTSPSKSTP